MSMQTYCRIATIMLAIAILPSILYANDAPTVSSPQTIGTVSLGKPFVISYEAILGATDAQDMNGDSIQFVIPSVSSGTLFKNGVDVSAGTTLDAGQTLVWNSGTNGVEAGDLPAFTVYASDGQAQSTTVTISVQVTDRVEDLLLKLVSPDAGTGSELGSVLAVDGEWAIVGAPGNDSYGIDAGVAYLYKWDGRIWSEYQKISGIDIAANAHFGRSVSLSATRAVIGADGSNNQVGAAYVFELTNGRWLQAAKLTPSDQATNGKYGFGVTLWGDYLAVLSPGSTSIGFVYELSNGQWVEVDTLTEATGASGAISTSTTLSMSGNRLAVGAPLNNSGAGAVFIYTRDASSTSWSQTSPEQLNGATGEQLGSSVSLDSDQLLVGAPGDTKACLYDWNGSQWSSPTPITTGTSVAGFGASVSVSDDLLVVGAPAYGSNAGAAYVYQRDGSSWVLDQSYESESSSGDLLGQSVAIGDDSILIGAPGDQSATGALYRDSIGSLTASATLPQEDVIDALVTGNRFGYDVDVSGDWMVATATWSWEADPALQGYVYVSKWDSIADQWGTPVALSLPSDIEASDYYGTAVAIEGDRIVVGAYAYDGKGTDSGAVFTYQRTGDTWGSPTMLVLPAGVGTDNNAQFGSALDMDGNRLVVGSSGNHAVYVFEWDDVEDDWGTQLALGWSGDGRLGSAVAISGDRIIAGAPLHDADDGSGGTVGWAGGAVVFDWNGTAWQAKPSLFASVPSNNARFGSAVAVNDQWVVAGAWCENSFDGAVYAFQWDSPSGSWVEHKLVNTGTLPTEWLAYSVAVSGNKIFAGAPTTTVDTYIGDAGVVCCFEWDGQSWTQTDITASTPSHGAQLGYSMATSDQWVVSGAARITSNKGAVYAFGQAIGSASVAELTGVATLSHSSVGISYGGSSDIVSNDSVNLTAVPAEGYVFSNWQGETAGLSGLGSATLSFTADSASRVLVPVFKAKPVISFAGDYASGATGGGTYVQGSNVTVSAGTGPTGSTFDGWGGQTHGMSISSGTLNDSTLTFSADQPRVLVPMFIGGTDTTAPVVSMSAIYASTASPALQGYVDDPDAWVKVTIDNQEYNATVNGTTWSIQSNTITALTQGVYTVSLQAGDLAGNVGSATSQLTIDFSTPIVTVNSQVATVSKPTLTGTVSDPLAVVLVSVGTQTHTATVTGTTWTVDGNLLTAIPDGVHSILAKATNQAGSFSFDTTSNELTIDTIGPVASFSSPLTTSDPALLQWSGTLSEAVTSVSVTVNGATVTAAIAGSTWTLPNGAFSTLTDGTYPVSVSAVDLAGNTGTFTGQLIVDTDTPIVTITSSLQTADTTPEIYGTVTGSIESVIVSINGQNLQAQVINGTWSIFASQITALANATYSINVLATSVSGQTGTASDDLIINTSMDQTLPSITVTDMTTSLVKPGLSGTIDDLPDVSEVTVTYKILNPDNSNYIPYQKKPAQIVDNKWTVSALQNWYLTYDENDQPTGLPANPLDYGQYTVVAKAVDKNGNEATATGTLTILPEVRVAYQTLDQSPSEITGWFGGVKEFKTGDILGVTVSVRDSSGTEVVSNVTATHNATNGSWTATMPGGTDLSQGVYDVVATATYNNGSISETLTDSTVGELTIEKPDPASSAQLSFVCDADNGLTELKLNNVTVMTGRTTTIDGYSFALTNQTGYAPKRDWLKNGWSGTRLPTSSYFSAGVGELYAFVGNSSASVHNTFKENPQIENDGPDHCVVTHTYNSTKLIYDHKIVGPDLYLTVTVDNTDSDYYYQIGNWMDMNFVLDSSADVSFKMGTYYPSGETYSPVTTIVDGQKGIGINYIEHKFRPLKIELSNIASSNNKNMKCKMRNAPVAPGTIAKYKIVLRFAEKTANYTPDFRYLLSPYKNWFNAYYGPVQYSADFRIHVISVCSARNADDPIDPNNPYAFREGMDSLGWQSNFLNARVGSLASHNTGPIIFWSVTGMNPRGVNYRPDFDVFPQVVEDTLPDLREYFKTTLSGKRFGFFARPNHIAYQQTNEIDNVANFNPFDYTHLRMANRRFERLRDQGVTSFYLDTYGAGWGAYPGSDEAGVYYLKQLRAEMGPDIELFTEFGFDATHLFAAIWPRSTTMGTIEMRDEPTPSVDDDMRVDLHLPLGNAPEEPLTYYRWLNPGATEVCRVLGYQKQGQDLPFTQEFGGRNEGYPRTPAEQMNDIWNRGAIPLYGDWLIGGGAMTIQEQYVNPDGSSKVRTDCRLPGQP
ncbi:MAG: hypothetical protein CMJ19_17825 [Phycisphaeraceae bacterium]|nr:hypothetical protein [Phycisphaeraceae bacterium]